MRADNKLITAVAVGCMVFAHSAAFAAEPMPKGTERIIYLIKSFKAPGIGMVITLCLIAAVAVAGIWFYKRK